MIPLLALVRKDLKLFFKDRKAVVVGILAPIVLASFFGYLFGGQKGNSETSKVPVLVVDQDGSDISRGLITQLVGDKSLDVKPSALDAARETVRKGKATAAIIIPKDFGRDAGHALFTGASKPELKVLYDPSRNVELGMVKGILSGAVMQAVSKEMFTGQGGRDVVNESLAHLDNDPQLPAPERKALRNLLGGVKELKTLCRLFKECAKRIALPDGPASHAQVARSAWPCYDSTLGNHERHIRGDAVLTPHDAVKAAILQEYRNAHPAEEA